METTLNIRVDILEKITIAAQSAGISRSEIIVLIIKKIMDEISDPGRLGSMVRYQDRSNADDWHVFHLQLKFDEYEYFLDLRKLLKMSVSLILAYAVKRYLKKYQKINSTDNYRYQNYVLMKEVIDGIISWRIIWGYPRNIEKLL